MTWEEIEKADPVDLLLMPADFRRGFEPIQLDGSVTIGMAAHGNVQTTLFALRALFASVSGDFDLILVDDASPDDTGKLFERVPTVHHHTRVFRFPHNVEYSGSLNTILSHAQGQYIIFISNDIFVTPSYMRQLLAVAECEPSAGLVRGCSNFVDNGLPLHSVKDCGDLDNFSVLFEYSENRAETFGMICHNDQFLTGDAFLITRTLLERIGFVDPRFYGYFADHDLGLRARIAGFQPLLALGAFAWHQHGSNIEYLKPVEKDKKVKSRWARVNENWARFKDKYGLPASLPYQGMRRIPWDGLATASEFLTNSAYPPCDHTQFMVPDDPFSREWRRYRASELMKRARIYINASRVTDAIHLCRDALTYDSENYDVMTLLGTAYVYQGRISNAIKMFRGVTKLSPAHIKAHSNLLLSMNYSNACSQQAISRESRRWESLHARQFTECPRVPPSKRRSRVRIAYLSPDFRSHSVSYFFSPLLKHHDREKFEIFCLSDALYTDAVTDRLIALSDGWRDVSRLDMDELEAVVREIQPDILVDLAGHTGHTIRLPLFSKRIAPVQITWLGYPNTTGLAAMDYRLTDMLTDPPGSPDATRYSEKLYRLPGGFLCYEQPSITPDVSQLPMKTNGYVTFGSFNMIAKITDAVIAVWSEILRRIPQSRLVLKNHYFRDVPTVKLLMRKFAKHGIDAERIDLLPADIDITTHLTRYGLIDIALDTFPYNGTTTTCEALIMGVPVITLSGQRHSCRVGAGILNRLGMGELIAMDREEYIQIAHQLAKNDDWLSKTRESLRNSVKGSDLCDAPAFTRSIETAYLHMLKVLETQKCK